MKQSLSKSQQTALKILKSGRNVYLKGLPGTGKTYLLNIFIQEMSKTKNIMCAASTGIAALNINGLTLHNICSIPIPAYGHYDFDITNASLKTLQDTDILILEEISMCRNDVFEYFYMFVKKAEKTYNKKIQVIVAGDFFQLAPVVQKDEESKLTRLGFDKSGYCFTTPAWDKFRFKIVELTDVMRQKDIEFLTALQQLRVGDTKCIDYFNQYVTDCTKLDVSKMCMYICATNAEVNAINDQELDKLQGDCYLYRAIKKGFSGKDHIVDENLILKIGARVMFVSNDTVNNQYHNGQLGIIKECKDKTVIVESNGKLIEVKPYHWANNKITLTNGIISKKEIGSYWQLPIKLAYATTMHKTQGQTYDNAIIDPKSFANGQLYVALSRLTTIDGLYLTEPIRIEDIKVNKLIIQFDNGAYTIPETRSKKRADVIKTATQKHKQKKKTTRKTTKKTATKRNTKKRTTRTKTTNSKTIRNKKR